LNLNFSFLQARLWKFAISNHWSLLVARICHRRFLDFEIWSLEFSTVARFRLQLSDFGNCAIFQWYWLKFGLLNSSKIDRNLASWCWIGVGKNPTTQPRPPPKLKTFAVINCGYRSFYVKIFLGRVGSRLKF
jgi:hypothetical protein